MRRTLLTWAVVSIAAFVPNTARAENAHDKAVAAQIATVLRDSGYMKNYSVGVKYREGTVWLSGRVTNEQQMQVAESIVSNLEGVEQIVNNLTVGSGGSGLRQPMQSARRTSYMAESSPMTANGPAAAAMVQPASADGGEVTPAGYRMLGHKKFHRPMAMYAGGAGAPPAAYDNPHMPSYAWPSYASYPNYAALSYPKQYSATAFPFIGPFYPYPQVPLGWRKVSLEWDDGWWFLDFKDRGPY